MATNFGKFCRKLRIDKEELLFDMAEKLGVSSAFLSKVENGKKKPPKEWKEKLITLYEIQGKERITFEEYFFEAENQKSIDISNYRDDQKEMMLAFARKIDVIDEDNLKKIKKIIDGR